MADKGSLAALFREFGQRWEIERIERGCEWVAGLHAGRGGRPDRRCSGYRVERVGSNERHYGLDGLEFLGVGGDGCEEVSFDGGDRIEPRLGEYEFVELASSDDSGTYPACRSAGKPSG
jgi:hypothetical protein